MMVRYIFPHFQLITLISYRTVYDYGPCRSRDFVCGMIVFFFFIYLKINVKFNTVYHSIATTIRTLNSIILNAAKVE